jgi:hypothetical protein
MKTIVSSIVSSICIADSKNNILADTAKSELADIIKLAEFTLAIKPCGLCKYWGKCSSENKEHCQLNNKCNWVLSN